MARLTIDTGTLGNPSTGDTLRTAMTKINTNFTDVYSLIADGSSGLIATDVTNGDLKLQANGTGSIEIDTLSVQNSTITSITTNSDITITPNGTGNVVLGNFTFNADQTVGASEDNYVFTYDHSTGTIGLEASAAGDVTASSTTTFTNKTFDANGTGNSISNIEVADFAGSAIINVAETLASNDSDTALVTAGAIIDYVDAQDANIASDTLTFTNKTFDVEGTGNSISNIDVADFKAAAIVTEAEGIGSNDNDTTLPTSAAVKDYVDARDIGDLSVVGSTISAPSNADLTLTTSGTGSVSIDGIQISGTEISSSDSTQVTIKENLHVTGNITGTLTGSVAFSNVTSTPTTIAGYGITDAASATATALTVVGDDSSGTAVTLGETFKVAGATGVTTAVSGDTLTITGPDLTSYVTASSSTTFTNKTFDVEGTGNSISNIDVADLKSGVLDTDLSSVSGSDDTLASAKAIKAYVDANSGGSTGDLTITGSTISSPSNAPLTLDPSGSGKVTAVGGLVVSGGDTETADITSSGQIDAVGFTSTGNSTFDGVQITDNKVTSASSNADLELDAAGTGGIIAQSPFTFNAGYIEKINTLTSSSTITVDCAAASIHTVTLGTNTEFNISNLPTGGSVTLIITQDGTGSRTATFGTDGSSAVKFPSNSSTLSTGAGDIDVVTIVNDGTNFLGNIAKDYRSS